MSSDTAFPGRLPPTAPPVMRAVRLPRYGPPEVFEELEAPMPEPGPAEVVVSTRAAGVNFADVLQRLGLYANAPRPPYVPGFEVAGEVAAVGEGVTDLAPGARVVAMVSGGGYAEAVRAPREQVWPLPEGVDFETAAAIPVNFLTAWICLFTMGHLRADETVLVHGGAGGVGTAAVQLARRRGARVLATAGSEAKLRWLLQHGVELALDYRQPDWDARVRERYGARPLDLVLDPVGGDTQRRSVRLLAPLGRLVSYGLAGAVAGPRRNLWRAWRAWRRTPRYHPVQMIGRNIGVFGFHL